MHSHGPPCPFESPGIYHLPRLSKGKCPGKCEARTLNLFAFRAYLKNWAFTSQFLATDITHLREERLLAWQGRTREIVVAKQNSDLGVEYKTMAHIIGQLRQLRQPRWLRTPEMTETPQTTEMPEMTERMDMNIMFFFSIKVAELPQEILSLVYFLRPRCLNHINSFNTCSNHLL